MKGLRIIGLILAIIGAIMFLIGTTAKNKKEEDITIHDNQGKIGLVLFGIGGIMIILSKQG